MANSCTNQILIKGSKDKIKSSYQNIKRTGELLNFILPYPEECDFKYKENGNEGIIQGWFCSRWSPPNKELAVYQKENPDVYIKNIFYEEGEGFAGIYEDQKVEGINNFHHFTPDEMENPKSGLIYEINKTAKLSEWIRTLEEVEKNSEEELFPESDETPTRLNLDLPF